MEPGKIVLMKRSLGDSGSGGQASNSIAECIWLSLESKMGGHGERVVHIERTS